MKLENINKSYGSDAVFEKFDFDIEDGKITAVLGASGSGKTTLLNIISKLTDFEGVADVPDRVSYLFQEERLIGNLTVFGNLNYVLQDIKNKAERNSLINEMLTKVELDGYSDKYPYELSGGMARRVAIARAFIYKAPLLLMDEPFKGLDVSLKKRIIELFEKIYAEDLRTVVFATHDIDEAILLADRIVAIEKGGKIIFDDIITTPRGERAPGDFAEIKNRLYEIL